MHITFSLVSITPTGNSLGEERRRGPRHSSEAHTSAAYWQRLSETTELGGTRYQAGHHEHGDYKSSSV